MTQEEYLAELENYQQLEAEKQSLQKEEEKISQQQRRSDDNITQQIKAVRANMTWSKDSNDDKIDKLKKKQTNLEKEMELSRTRLEKYGGKF